MNSLPSCSSACRSSAPNCIRAQAYETRGTYTVGKGRAVYTKADIDFLAAVVSLDIYPDVGPRGWETAGNSRFRTISLIS